MAVALANGPHLISTWTRVYLVGTRLYQVMVMGTKDYAASKEADAFLDSFQVTD